MSKPHWVLDEDLAEMAKGGVKCACYKCTLIENHSNFEGCGVRVNKCVELVIITVHIQGSNPGSSYLCHWKAFS